MSVVFRDIHHALFMLDCQLYGEIPTSLVCGLSFCACRFALKWGVVFMLTICIRLTRLLSYLELPVVTSKVGYLSKPLVHKALVRLRCFVNSWLIYSQ